MKYIISILLFTSIYSCSNPKSITFTEHLINVKKTGYHSRGVDVKGEHIVFSGKSGHVFSINQTDSLNQSYILDSIEDFRDVYITTDYSILLLNSGTNGQIWKLLADGSKELVFNQDSLFLDGFSFFENSKIGFAYGDPIDSTFIVLKTIDNGNNWTQISTNLLPKTLTNEAGFAASGTGIQTPKQDIIYIGTGIADTARLIRSFDNGETWDVVNTPIKSGDSFGIYSMYFNSTKKGYIIGGSYKETTYNEKICYYTKNKGKNWTNISNGLPGYMSCIHGNKNHTLLVTTGRLGSYYSLNKGKEWKLLSQTPYYTCVVTDSKIVFSGKDGTFKIIEYYLY